MSKLTGLHVGVSVVAYHDSLASVPRQGTVPGYAKSECPVSCWAVRVWPWGDVCPHSRAVAQSWAWGGESGISVAVVPTEQPWSLVLLTFFFCPD